MNSQQNITLRRAHTQIAISRTSETDNNMSIDTLDVTTNSLPDITTDEEQVSLLLQKVEQLQLQLNSAHDEIEQLSLELRLLSKTNQELTKKNVLYKKIGNSPAKFTSPTLSTPMKTSKSKPKLHKHTQTESEEKKPKSKSKIIHKSTQTMTETSTKNTQTLENVNETSSSQKNKTKNNSSKKDDSNQQPSTSKDETKRPVVQVELSSSSSSGRTQHPTYEQKDKKKICILSTNKDNKILDLAEDYLGYNSEICHYLKPNTRVNELLNGIDVKLADFTMADFCIVLIGEEHFKTTQDYFSTIKNIRDIMQEINNTNIILCLPTYRCANLNDMYNWRIESFNNLLYLDVETYEHAYLFDSNRKLEYDSTMFNKYSGKINNNGMRRIFQNLKTNIDHIEKLNTTDKEQEEIQSGDIIHSDRESTFFRD